MTRMWDSGPRKIPYSLLVAAPTYMGICLNNPINFVDPTGLLGLFGPGFSNIRGTDSPSWVEQSNNYTSPIDNIYRGNAIPGQFRAAALSPITEVAPLAQREFGPLVNTIRLGLPNIIVIEPVIEKFLGPSNAAAATPCDK